MRNERKFTAPKIAAEFARGWLQHVCIPDLEFPSGRISSIYYDTLELSSYQEKANGDYLKTKVRLRWYHPTSKDETGQIPAFLEIKTKEGLRGDKLRKKIFFPEHWLDQVPLENVTLTRVIYENAHELGIALPAGLFAILTVVYDRERFICPYSGARVSLDTSIRSAQTNREILPCDSAPEIETIVLEIKEKKITEVPWLDRLYEMGFRSQSFSKYGMCLSKFVHGV